MGFDLGITANLIGSLGLFLFGMKVMSDALMALAGNSMRDIMARLTENRFKGVLTGLFITSLIQSSSATTLMVVSFVNAGLLKLTEAIGVIMGANIGTTLTAWLIAVLGFRVQMGDIALPFMIVGVALYLRNEHKPKNWGLFIIGFSLLFVGLEMMKTFVPDLGSNPVVYDFIRGLSGNGLLSTLLFLAIGTLLTLILQSSSATMAITLVAAGEGWLPFDAAAALILGENVGTTITANLAALVAGTRARRAALAHLVFNVIGVIWVIVLFELFMGLIHGTSRYLGASPLTNPEDVPISLALFHSLFNIMNTALLIGFVRPIARLVEYLLKEKPQPVRELTRPRYLRDEFLKYPQTAIHALLLESRRLYRNAIFEAASRSIGIHRKDIISNRSIERIVADSRGLRPMDFEEFSHTRIQPIYTAVVDYASKIQETFELSHEQNGQVTLIKHANRDVLDILRNLAAFHGDLARYIRSDNSAIRAEYDKLRTQVVRLIRDIATQEAPETPVEAREQLLTELWKKIQDADNRVVIETDRLIRVDAITPRMGAALIGSSATMRHICKDLIKVARRLGGAGPSYDELEMEFEELMAP